MIAPNASTSIGLGLGVSFALGISVGIAVGFVALWLWLEAWEGSHLQEGAHREVFGLATWPSVPCVLKFQDLQISSTILFPRTQSLEIRGVPCTCPCKSPPGTLSSALCR